MKLEGIHHITAITGDAPRNVDFYVRVLGLRLVKKSVNQDDPTVYHLFYADENGSAGSDLTFFEYPNARPGRAGAGMVHRIVAPRRPPPTRSTSGRTGSAAKASRRRAWTAACASPTRRASSTSCVVVDVPDPPLAARSTEVPDEHALLGFHAVHAAVADPRKTETLLRDDARLRRRAATHAFEARGDARGGSILLRGRRRPRLRRRRHDPPHRVGDDVRRARRVARARRRRPARRSRPVIDRFYFRSVYFREPGGILFELASIGPGFTTDEPLETLGERLALPPDFEQPARAGRAAAHAAAGRAAVAAGASRVSAPQRLSISSGSAAPTTASAPRGPASAMTQRGEHRARAGRQPVGALDDRERAGADAVVREALQQRDARRSRRASSRPRAPSSASSAATARGSAASASSGSPISRPPTGSARPSRPRASSRSATRAAGQPADPQAAFSQPTPASPRSHELAAR